MEEVKNNIGDIFWFLSLLANSCDIDIDEAIEHVIKDNKERFPVEKTKDQHTNTKLDGFDKKYE